MKALRRAAALPATGTTASAVDRALVQPALHRKGRDGCHDVDALVGGPSHHAVATRCRRKPDERGDLAGTIRKGSENPWRAAAMPPSGQVDDLEPCNVAERLVAGAPGRTRRAEASRATGMTRA